MSQFFDDVDTTPVCAFPWAGPIYYDASTLELMWQAMVHTYPPRIIITYGYIIHIMYNVYMPHLYVEFLCI